MQVGGVEVVLLVPEGGGQDDVGVQRRGVHAEVKVNHQIELAARGRFAEGDTLDLALGVLLGHDVVVRAEVVALEELGALATGGHGVAAPDEPHPRPVLLRVGVVYGEVQVAVLELLRRVVRNLFARLRARGLRLAQHFHRVAVELRIVGHPAQAHGHRFQVYGVPLGPLRLGRHGRVIGEVAFVTPLVAVDVVPRGGLLEARHDAPVLSEGQTNPRRHEGQFFLADVMVHAAAVAPAAAAQNERGDGGAVGQVVVVPMVDARADDDHRAAIGSFGVVRELTRQANDRLAPDAGVLFLPCRSVRPEVVVGVTFKLTLTRIIAGEAASDSELGH